MDLFDLSGTVAVVTGGNGGIGLGFATGLAKAGADVAVWGRNADKNAAAAESLSRYGTQIVAMQCDVSDEGEVETAFAETLERLGRVDSVFANAGIAAGGTRFTDMALDEWRRIFSVNAEGVFLTLREATRHMVERGGGGSLVVTSSVSAMMGAPRSEHYAATKAGAIAMARALAVEFGRHGIRANAVVPGWIETEMTKGFITGSAFETKVLPRVPAGRFGKPSDFEAIAVYLASEASHWHTGDVITIDGGYTVF